MLRDPKPRRGRECSEKMGIWNLIWKLGEKIEDEECRTKRNEKPCSATGLTQNTLRQNIQRQKHSTRQKTQRRVLKHQPEHLHRTKARTEAETPKNQNTSVAENAARRHIGRRRQAPTAFSSPSLGLMLSPSLSPVSSYSPAHNTRPGRNREVGKWGKASCGGATAPEHQRVSHRLLITARRASHHHPKPNSSTPSNRQTYRRAPQNPNPKTRSHVCAL